MTGTKRINKVIDKFTVLVTDLETGADDVQKEIVEVG